MAGRPDTVINTVFKQTSIAKYTAAGAVVGALASVALVAHDLAQCGTNTHNSNGMACLGFNVVAPMLVIGGTFVGGAAGLIVGVVRRSYE
ncbi:MAG: hypothetical protein M3Z05_09650 [Gemmatimonadota bacterium]|nr:hypothetical protein [Gemmatimonadota bacterium]